MCLRMPASIVLLCVYARLHVCLYGCLGRAYLHVHALMRACVCLCVRLVRVCLHKSNFCIRCADEYRVNMLQRQAYSVKFDHPTPPKFRLQALGLGM